MTNLTEQDQYEDGIYQIEKSDPVVGGPDGLSNRQAQQLANRSRWLKTRLDGLLDGSRIAALATRLAIPRKINGVAFDGSADITVQDASKAPLDSPALTGKPTAPTAEAAAIDQRLATTEFVGRALQTSVSKLVDNAPSSLNTLQKLATALGNDVSFATSLANALSTKLPLAGGQMEGPLRGKVGDANTGGFVFDTDTGLFSSAEDRLQLVAGGKVLLEGSLKGPLQTSCGLRVPKDAPAALDDSYQSGYTFGADGDTGLFAEGGTANSSSNLVLRIDNIEVGRLALFTKLSSPNGFARLLNGQILQWAEFSVNHSAGQIVAWQVTLPTTFPTQCLQKFAVLGSGCTPSKVCLTVEGGRRNSLEGFLYSEIEGSRTIRVFAIGE